MKSSYPTMRTLAFLVALLAVFLFVFYALFALFTSNVDFPSVTSEKSLASPSIKYNPWGDLSILETRAILEYLHNSPNNLKLSSAASLGSSENYVVRTELLRPNKSQALSYVDGKSAVKPPRWATVLVYNGSGTDATLDEYAVGPLPPSAQTEIRPLTFYHNSGKSSSPNLVPDSASLQEWPNSVARNISDITQSLFGSTVNSEEDSNPDGLEISFRDPWIDRDGRTVRWCLFQREGKKWDTNTLLPQGLYFKIDTTGRDPTEWKVLNWFYNNVLYNSTEEFRTAWMMPGFEITPRNLDGEWTHIDDDANFDSHPKQSPSIPIDLGKQSFTLNKDQRIVSWKGFEFYLAFSQAAGLALFDIRFQNEKILYELGLQEALSHYAGKDPVQGAAKYLDSAWGMGATMFELVPGMLSARAIIEEILKFLGYDCPDDAQFMDVQFSVRTQMVTHRNAICFFEHKADYPLQRHSTDSYVSVSHNTYFVVRTVAVVGNYDYSIDYIFYLDGSIEVKFRASGYIQGAYYVPGESEEYGYRVHDQFASSLHDHVLNFKADFDILGQENTLVSVDIEPATVQYPWAPGERRSTMKLARRVVETETGLTWPANSGSHLVVLNNGSSNSWGEKRGYRIMPGSGMGAPAHLTFQGSETLGRAAEWAQKDLWVSRQKDTEAKSSSPASNFIPDEPMIDFGKFIDGESVVQEDL
ncbi:hypothetical protein PWT90_00324 [Aphanocladium album]|nr:hypothetical protein PWT90_00324 [Aphanocladium album]